MLRSLQRAFSQLPAALGLPPRHTAPAWIVKPLAPQPDPVLEITMKTGAVWLFVMTAANVALHVAPLLH